MAKKFPTVIRREIITFGLSLCKTDKNRCKAYAIESCLTTPQGRDCGTRWDHPRSEEQYNLTRL